MHFCGETADAKHGVPQDLFAIAETCSAQTRMSTAVGALGVECEVCTCVYHVIHVQHATIDTVFVDYTPI